MDQKFVVVVVVDFVSMATELAGRWWLWLWSRKRKDDDGGEWVEGCGNGFECHSHLCRERIVRCQVCIRSCRECFELRNETERILVRETSSVYICGRVAELSAHSAEWRLQKMMAACLDRVWWPVTFDLMRICNLFRHDNSPVERLFEGLKLDSLCGVDRFLWEQKVAKSIG